MPRLASEINAACDSKQLECDRQWLAELPPVTWSQLGEVPQRMLSAIAMVFSARQQSVDGRLTLGTIDQFRADLRFLNYPFIMRPEPAAKMLLCLARLVLSAGRRMDFGERVRQRPARCHPV